MVNKYAYLTAYNVCMPIKALPAPPRPRTPLVIPGLGGINPSTVHLPPPSLPLLLSLKLFFFYSASVVPDITVCSYIGGLGSGLITYLPRLLLALSITPVCHL